MNRYRWLLFDADGTLFNYDRAELSALRRTFESFSINYHSSHAEIYREINGRIWREFELGLIDQISLRTRRFSEMFDALGLQADADRFSQQYLRFLSQGTYLMAGAEQVVKQLHSQFRMVIITNGLQDVQRPRFTTSSIGSFFDHWIISEEVGAAKPDPAIFDIAFQRLDYPSKDEVLIIGDSLTSDMAGGINYGIDTCWFNPSSEPRIPNLNLNFEIHDLRQLIDLLLPLRTL